MFVAGVVALLAVLGPGPGPEPEGRITAAARAADAALIRQAVASACGPGVAAQVSAIGADRYRLATGASTASIVTVSRDTGFAAGVRHVVPVGAPIACPAP